MILKEDIDLFERFTNIVEKYIVQEYASTVPTRKILKILLAVSGGVDSIVMLDLFDRLTNLKSSSDLESVIYIGVATFNHRLRKEADEEVQFVREICRLRDIPFYTESGDVMGFAQENKYSVEESARVLRYAFLNKIAQENQYDYISTAHNANDLLETVLLRLSKGTGPFGLAGIKPISNQYFRPLLFFTREEIEKYAESRNLGYAIDKSNFDVKYQRNFIRHEIVPLLKKINPSVEKAVLNLSESIWKLDDYLNNILKSNENVVYFDDRLIFRLVDNKYLQTEQVRRMALEFFRKPLDKEKLERFEKCKSESFKVSFWNGLGIEVSLGWAMMGRINDYPQKCIRIDLNQKNLEGTSQEYEFNRYFIKLDFHGIMSSRIERDLEIRNWIEGDRLSNGKKVKVLFNNRKVPTFLRRLMPLVTFDGKVVFIPYLYEDKRMLESIDIGVQVKGGLCFES